jgi:hypothetical protein
VSENGLLEPYLYQNDLFTKTGSGQTQGKHSETDRFLSFNLIDGLSDAAMQGKKTRLLRAMMPGIFIAL